MPNHINRTTKLAPGRFRFDHVVVARHRQGPEQPVAKKNRDQLRSYCECGRRLNSNNRRGVCRTCDPHGNIWVAREKREAKG